MWCVFLAAFSPEVNIYFLLSTVLYFNHINLSSPLAPLWGIYIRACRLFCTKFRSEQLLFEAFLNVMCISGSVEPYIECILPFLYSIIFQPHQSFEPCNSTPVGDRHMRWRTFLYRTQFQTTFIGNFFRCDVYFWQHSTLKWMYFLFQPYQSFEPPSSTTREIEIYARGLYCTKFNSEQFLFEDFLDVMRIFGSVQP